ncbi:MAG: DUF2804 domain-containing protein [Treponema sp.]|nr:DUF2804 domain-containing protein [Treponema sp.]
MIKCSMLSGSRTTEASGPLPVVDEAGRPQNFGWARGPAFVYDPGALWTPRNRISESDRYVVFNETHTVALEMRDDGYTGQMNVAVARHGKKKVSNRVFNALLPMGAFKLPRDGDSGAARYRQKGVELDFVAMEGGARIIRVSIPARGSSRIIRGELVLSRPSPAEGGDSGAECLACNLPARSDARAFRLARCAPWYLAGGDVQIGETEIVFTRGNAWGIFDWSRGVRPKRDARYVASACGASKGRLVGFCAGYGAEDDSQGTRNAFFVDGRIHKLDQITFHIPPRDWLSPWSFTSSDGRLEMTFAPQQERADRGRFFLHSHSRRQFFGFFSGRAILDDGRALEFSKIAGFAERAKTRH